MSHAVRQAAQVRSGEGRRSYLAPDQTPSRARGRDTPGAGTRHNGHEGTTRRPVTTHIDDLPASNRRHPRGPDQSSRQRRPPVSCAEVMWPPVGVEHDACLDSVTAVYNSDVECVAGAGRGPRRGRVEQHRRCEQNCVVELGDQFADVEFRAGAVGHGHQAEEFAAHPPAPVLVGVPAGHQ